MATNNLEIQVKLGIADLEKKVQQSRDSIKSLSKEKAEVILDLKKDKLQADFNKIKADLQALSSKPATAEINLQKDKLVSDLAGIKSQLKGIEKLSIEINIDKSKLQNAIAEIKTGISREIGAQIAQGLAALPAQIGKTTLEFEKLQTVLKTTLGSQGEADKAFALIKDFAASTPFQVSQITDGFIKLQNRGITPTRELLTQLGDLASSQGKGLDQVIEAVLDASTGEFERLKEFGIQASKAGDQVTIAFKGTQQTVANTPESINKAIASLGSLKGVAGGMEAQSKTLGGALSNLQDTADTLSVAFGNELAPILLEIVKGFSESGASAEGFARGAGQNVGNAIKFLVDNSNALKTVLELVVLQFGLTKAAAAATSIQLAIAAGNAAIAAGGFNALVISLNASAAAAVAAAAPLAIAFAAFKAGEFIIAERNLREFNDQLDSSAKQANFTGQQTFKLAEKLRSLNEARKAGKGDLAKEKGFLDIANKELQTLENLKKEQLALASTATNDNQRSAAQSLAKDYEIQAKALQGQITSLQSSSSVKSEIQKKTKEQIKQEEDLIKLSKDKADADRAANDKRISLLRDEGRKTQEKGIETNRDRSLEDLKIKQEEAISKFKLDQENKFTDKKLAGEKSIQDFKESKELALENKKLDFTQTQEDLKSQAQKRRQADADDFRKSQEDADRKFQEEKQKRDKAFQDSLLGAKGLVDRETAIGTAKDPKEAEKLKKQFEEQDRIRQQILSTNVDTKSSKEQFAQQAKSIAGVDAIKSQEDAAKVQFALAELEAKAKAQFADEERLKEQDFKDKLKADEIAFNDGQRIAEETFSAKQKQDAINFEQNVIKPQKDAIEAEVQTKKLAFERDTLQPLKLAQETELAAFKKQQETDVQAIKLKAETELEALKKQFKLEDINLDNQAQKERLDREFAFKDSQRKADLENAKAIAQILSAATINKIGASAALGTGDIPKFSKGVENFGGGLAYVHSGEVLMNLSKGTSVIPASQVSGGMMGGGDVVALLRQIAINLNQPSVTINGGADESIIGEIYRQNSISKLRGAGL